MKKNCVAFVDNKWLLFFTIIKPHEEILKCVCLTVTKFTNKADFGPIMENI